MYILGNNISDSRGSLAHDDGAMNGNMTNCTILSREPGELFPNTTWKDDDLPYLIIGAADKQ